MAESVSPSSPEESPEYTVMRERTAEIVDGITSSIVTLGDELFAKRLISFEVKEYLTLTGITQAYKARKVFDCVIRNVKNNPQIFHDFVKVLKEQDAKELANQLDFCYESQTPTPPPSSSLSQIPWNDDPNYLHTVSGTRDILLLVSKVSGDNIVPRRPRASLTEEEKHKLQKLGIQDLCHSDPCIMKAIYATDKECTLAGELTGEQKTCEEVKKAITQLFNSTKKHGVILKYIGPGERETGNWCFKDGVISFEEIMELYTRHLKPRILVIASDCSYSGCWVKKAMTFMDRQGVGPCGHQAKEKGILFKVVASCLANEVPAELAYSANFVKIDKDGKRSCAGKLRCKAIHDNQHPSVIDFTEVRCKHKIDQPCTMAPESTWQQWSDWKRTKIVRVKDRGAPVWHYVLLEDNEDTRQRYLGKGKEGFVNAADYGKVLESGCGDYPPEDIKKRIEHTYCVNYNYQPSPNTTD